jgi:hypothetical protein
MKAYFFDGVRYWHTVVGFEKKSGLKLMSPGYGRGDWVCAFRKRLLSFDKRKLLSIYKIHDRSGHYFSGHYFSSRYSYEIQVDGFSLPFPIIFDKAIDWFDEHRDELLTGNVMVILIEGWTSPEIVENNKEDK